MKSGASDPFDDETTGDDTEPMQDEPDESTTGSESETPTDLSREELPLILRREKVKDERPEVHQLFVQQGTHEQAIEAERELESMLGVDLSRTDAREAIYLAGMANLDAAADTLRRWGYDL